MNTKFLSCSILLLTTVHLPVWAGASGAPFSYEGLLSSDTVAANGIYDLRFALYDAPITGSQVGPTFATNAFPITNGYFSLVLDFGNDVFTGSPRWLELSLRTNSVSESFITLWPRQAILPVPYATMAMSASNLLGALPASQLTGTVPLVLLPAAVVTNNQAGVVLTGLTRVNNLSVTATNYANYLVVTNPPTFNGSAVTNLNASQLASGTVPLTRLPAAVVTNNQIDVVLNGLTTVSNLSVRATNYANYLVVTNPPALNGSAITNINGGSIALGTITSAQLASGAVSQLSTPDGAIGNAVQVVNNANVGIGTTTPAAKLDVVGNLAYSGQLSKLDLAEQWEARMRSAELFLGHSSRHGSPGRALVDDTDNALSLNYARDWQAIKLFGNVVVDPWNENTNGMLPGLAFGWNSGEGIASKRSTNENQWGLDFYTSYQPRMSIANNGNIGMGTTSPESTLHVNGNALMKTLDLTYIWGGMGVNATWDNGISNWKRIDDGYASMFQQSAVSGGFNWHVAETGSAGEAVSWKMPFRLNKDGDVVIDPGSANTNGTLTGGLRFGGDGSGEGIASKRSERANQWGLDFFTMFQPRMSIANNGNVGIGTNVPATRLHVLGGGDTEISIQSSDPAGHRWTLQASGNEPGQGRFEIIDRTLSANRFTILTNGNVGVGTSNPQTALHVKGTATADNFVGSGSGLTGISGAVIFPGSITTTSLAPNAVTGDKIANSTITAADVAPNTFWATTGNVGTTPGTHYLGTTDNQPLELRVNNARGLRLEPGVGSSVNMVAGWAGNSVASGVAGATIGGGGAGNYYGFVYSNRVEADFGTVSGGAANKTASLYATIGGGVGNAIKNNASTATIGGGYYNIIQTNATYATIGGGGWNTNEASSATIGGGLNNAIQTNASLATIGGGSGNTIQTNAYNSTIGGGYANIIERSASYATIGGGYLNTSKRDTYYATIGGGFSNTNETFAYCSSIGGGSHNTIQSNGYFATIAGGENNTIRYYGSHATIGGGDGNTTEQLAYYSTIPGGSSALASSYGQMAYASGSFAKVGDAQSSLFVARCITSVSNAQEMFLDGSYRRIAVPSNTVWTFEILVAARGGATTNSHIAAYRINGLIENTAGLISLPAVKVTTIYQSDPDLNVAVTGDNAHDALAIWATGREGVSIKWVASVRTAEVSW